MGIVVIPFNYEELPESERSAVIPICIESVDPQGETIAPVWFEQGVAPIQKQLVGLARVSLGDGWLVSELAEVCIHKLWAKHGCEAGVYPWRRVWRTAVWVARDLAAGDWRVRKQRVVLKSMADWETEFPQRSVDPTDSYHHRLLLGSLEKRMRQTGCEEMCRVCELLLLGHTWREVGVSLGLATEEPLKRRFYRWRDRNNHPPEASPRS